MALAYYTLILLVLWVPWPLASYRPGHAGIGIALTGFALLCATFSTGHAPQKTLPVDYWRWPVLLFSLALAWAVLQSLPIWPEGVYHPLWAEAAAALGRAVPGFAPISAGPGYTQEAALRLAAYGACFWLASRIAIDESKAAGLLKIVFAVITLTAVAGLILEAAGSLDIFFESKKKPHGYFGRLTGPFGNANMFAFYLGMGAFIGTALLYRALHRAAQHSDIGRVRAAHIITQLFTRHIVIVLALLVILIALVLTASRAGVMLSAAGLMVLTLSFAVHRRINWRPVVTGLILFPLVLAPAFTANTDLLETRIERDGLTSDGREDIYAGAWQLFESAPYLGVGYGAYRDVADSTRSVETLFAGRLYYAHSAWLEALLGLGAPAAALLFAALMFVGVQIWRGYWRRQRNSHYALIAAISATICALHSFVEGPTQAPAAAFTLAVIMGVGYAQSVSSREL